MDTIYDELTTTGTTTLINNKIESILNRNIKVTPVTFPEPSMPWHRWDGTPYYGDGKIRPQWSPANIDSWIDIFTHVYSGLWGQIDIDILNSKSIRSVLIAQTWWWGHGDKLVDKMIAEGYYKEDLCTPYGTQGLTIPNVEHGPLTERAICGFLDRLSNALVTNPFLYGVCLDSELPVDLIIWHSAIIYALVRLGWDHLLIWTDPLSRSLPIHDLSAGWTIIANPNKLTEVPRYINEFKLKYPTNTRPIIFGPHLAYSYGGKYYCHSPERIEAGLKLSLLSGASGFCLWGATLFNNDGTPFPGYHELINKLRQLKESLKGVDVMETLKSLIAAGEHQVALDNWVKVKEFVKTNMSKEDLDKILEELLESLKPVQ